MPKDNKQTTSDVEKTASCADSGISKVLPTISAIFVIESGKSPGYYQSQGSREGLMVMLPLALGRKEGKTP